MTLLDLDDVRAAARRLDGVVLRTPLLPGPSAGDGARTLLLKPENLQVTGSFKLRGAYNRLASLSAAERERGVVAHSSGNHGNALAYAGRLLDVEVTVVVPETAAPVKVDAIRRHGASVRSVPASDLATAVGAFAKESGSVVVPPFDDLGVIAGQGTVGLEIFEQTLRMGVTPDTVLVPVSGGGLISGVAAALKRLLPAVRVIGVEPKTAADARESLRTGQRVAWPTTLTGRTLADGMRSSSVGVIPFAHIQEYVDDIVTVSENEIRETVAVLARESRVVAEPSGSVTTAAYLHRRDDLPPGRLHVAVVSGGNIDTALLSRLLARYGGAR
ncbi:threonine ammonia-lyase [Streptomyces aureus]|uniref:threonine ammonia-lyase n=1 Tax=Streptomyces aureus TaxID=193461 RepID=UPI00055CFDA4|nr:threonine/serine dehydratase [Streptomyces aureus]